MWGKFASAMHYTLKQDASTPIFGENNDQRQMTSEKIVAFGCPCLNVEMASFSVSCRFYRELKALWIGLLFGFVLWLHAQLSNTIYLGKINSFMSSSDFVLK